ncbi:MAG: PaaI family thioesterase [Polyangiales bacterium]
MTAEALQKTRTYAYPRPIARTPEVRALTGLELLRKQLVGELPKPPIAATLDFRLVEVEEGRVVFEGEPSDFVLNPSGIVHGGYGAAILDSALGCAVQSMLPSNVGFTTVELKVNYVRAIRPGEGRIRAEGRIVHAGNNLLTAEGSIVRLSDGKLAAHATTTCMALR